jgi:hypothetical protein
LEERGRGNDEVGKIGNILTGNLPHGYGNSVIQRHLWYTFLLNSRDADAVAAGDSRIDKS